MVLKNEKRSEKQKIKKIVDDMCLFDDDLMERAFDKNIPATEYVLTAILGEKVVVKSVTGQYKMLGKAKEYRNITLDIFAVLKDNIHVNIEVQGLSKGAVPKRARFHSSMLDTRMLKAGEDFEKLKPSYVIFICKDDIFKRNKAVYKFQRIENQDYFNFDDDSFIYYVNGKYEGNDEIGNLIHDFHQTKPENIHSKILQKTVGYIKGTEKGEYTMCDAVEKYAEERALKARNQGMKQGKLESSIQSIRNLMLNMSCDIDKAFDLIGTPESDRPEIKEAILQEN